MIIDTDRKSVQLQPENSIIVDKWKGDVDDRTLWELVPLLQSESDAIIDRGSPLMITHYELCVSTPAESCSVNLSTVLIWGVPNDY